MLQLTSFSQKISLLLVLSLLSTLVPGPTAISGTRQAATTTDSPGFVSPLPTPTPQSQVATFTSPLPTPPAPVPEPVPALGLTVRAEPMGVAPGEMVTLTLRLDNSTGTALSGVSVSVTLPDALHRIPEQADWIYEAREKRLDAEARTLAAGAGVTLTLTLRAAGLVDTPVPLTFESVGGEARAVATAEVWVVQPGRARVTPEVGGLLVSPDRSAWARFPARAVDKPTEVTFEEVRDLPAFLPYSLGRAFAVQGLAPSVVGVRISRKELAADSVSWQLAALFQYSEAAERWERLETVRRWEGDDLVLTARVEGTGVFAAALSIQSDLGNYAQPWQPTVRDYQVDLFTGAAMWEVPIDTPPGRNGQAPALTLRYHSGVVDELRGDVNPQASWVGLGWNLDSGYIARKIELDRNLMPQCTEEYYLVLNGVSSKLIPIGNNEYRTEDERYWRIQRITSGAHNQGGDYWLVTVPDGTQYRFGYADETDSDHNDIYSAWWMISPGCDSNPDLDIINWRWNLDHVADVHGNIMMLQYRTVGHNNFRFGWCHDLAPIPGHEDAIARYNYTAYNPCGGPDHCLRWDLVYNFCTGQWEYREVHERWESPNRGYIPGGYLYQITYNWGETSPAYKVIFGTAPRPDYPGEYDSTGGGVQDIQTFWSRERLTAITVTLGSGEVIRRYELGYDGNRLARVQEIAADGTRLPAMTFGYLDLAGYSSDCEQGHQEGRDDEHGYKPWLVWVSTGYGGSIGFNYTAPLNMPSGYPFAQNGQTMGPNEGGKCWYRYRVREVEANPGVGAVMRTAYEYRTAGDNNPHDGSWSGNEFRGHPRVRVLQRGESGAVVAYSDHWFHQGLGQSTATGICGGDVADAGGLQGREYKQVQYDSSGNALAVQTTRWQVSDLGGGRRFVAPVAACAYPNGGSGPYARTDYAYDSYGNVARVVQYGDATRSGDEATVEREYGYNTGRWIVNRVATERLVGGDGATVRESRYAYDGQPWGTAPITGSLTAVMQGLAGWGWVTITFQYDPWGNRIATTDPLGRVTRTGYDAVYRQYPVSTTNALTQTMLVQWDLRLSVPVVITDANNAPTRYTYDPFGRLTGVTYPGESVPAVKYAYPTGNAVSAPWAITAEVRADPYTTPTYQRSWTFYGGLGRPVQTQAQAENGWLVVQDTAYDALGRAVTVTLPYTVAAAGGNYIPPNWNRPKTVTRYDALGRAVQVTGPDGSVTRQAYRDWRELVLDPNGHQTEYERDGLGRLIAVREYYGTYAQPTWDAPNPAETRYWYDAAGNLIAVRDALGNATRMQYDPLGRKVAMDDSSMGHWEYRYDAAGNLTKQRDARGQGICFYYDALNRLVGKTYHAGIVNLDGLACPGGPYAVSYAYDQGTNGVGRRTGMTDATGVTAWQYDARGRVLTETRTLNGIGTFVTGWEYDVAGRAVRQVYPDGEVVTTAYNLRELPVSVGGQSTYLTGATYNALGQPLQQVWGNGRATTYAYHPQSVRLTQLAVSGALLDLRYGYDRVGNITAITDTVNSGQVQTFGYDARDRLVWARTNGVGNGQYNEAYGYDRMGNIITRTIGGAPQSYTYGCPPPSITSTLPPTLTHRVYFPLVMKGYGPESPPMAACVAPFAVVSTTAGFRAAYDPNGNMVLRVEVSGTQRITYTQGWDAENRLAVVTNTITGQITRFVYDGDGNRVLRRVDWSETTVYIGDYYEREGSTVRKYYYAGGQRIAVRVNGTLYFLHGDHLASAMLATDANGNKFSEQRYSPYGVTRYGSSPTDRQFTGQRNEASLGLYDYGARMYSPSLGRFVSADVLVPNPAAPQSLNRYAYVQNRPLVYVDDDGRLPIIPLLIAGGLVVLKVVDYGWTAYDVYQSGRTLANPLATDEDKLIAGFNIVLSVGLEAAEPDDWLPASLPLDDVARRGVVMGLREAIQEGGLKAGVRFIRETVGEAAPQVIRHLYDQGLFRGIRSADEWGDILNGVRRGADLDVHHLIERRFAEQLGLDPGDIPAVVLDRTFHEQEVTARLFSRELGLPTRGSYSPQQIWEAYARVYGAGPQGLNRLDWLEAIWPYFERLGVQR